MMYELRDIGFSSAVGIGGDPVIGTTHIDCLAFEEDLDTDAIVMIGEIGGDAGETGRGLHRVHHVTKPVVGYVAGFTAAPEGKTMGRRQGIISGSSRARRRPKKEALEIGRLSASEKTPRETAALARDIMRTR